MIKVRGRTPLGRRDDSAKGASKQAKRLSMRRIW